MNQEAGSLDRLHDIVLPPEVPWWPPAPGWYVLGTIVGIVLLVLFVRAYLQWRVNAYRREALRALDSANDAASIGALLRRTALFESPRSDIAKLHGDAWVDWLAARGSQPVSPVVRKQLVSGAYAGETETDIAALRTWAAHWIKSHRPLPTHT